MEILLVLTAVRMMVTARVLAGRNSMQNVVLCDGSEGNYLTALSFHTTGAHIHSNTHRHTRTCTQQHIRTYTHGIMLAQTHIHTYPCADPPAAIPSIQRRKIIHAKLGAKALSKPKAADSTETRNKH